MPAPLAPVLSPEVPPGIPAAEWERCALWLEAALHRGGDTLTMEQVRERVQSGQYWFWPAASAAAITQVILGPKKEFNVLLAGGDMETLEQMLVSMEQAARQIGCALITVLGRRGWERTFLCQTAGYRPVATLYGKLLDGTSRST